MIEACALMMFGFHFLSAWCIYKVFGVPTALASQIMFWSITRFVNKVYR
jgi:hypothetical protein